MCCLLFFVAFLTSVNIDVIVCSQKLQPIDHLQILARHGERFPLFPVPELGEFVIGGLTPKGYQLEKDFGVALGSWYPEFFAAKPVVLPISANQSRCIDTAIAIIEGLNVEKSANDIELLPMIDITDVNVTVILSFLKKASEIELPACVQEAVTNVVTPATGALPANVSALLEVLFVGQLTDTIDTLIQSGYTGDAFGINLGTCIPPGKKLMTGEAFAQLTEICVHTQCTGIINRLKDELQGFSAQNSPPRSITKSASVYGLTDVHVLDILKSILPQFNHTRPQFGGYIILETRGDDVTILTGQDVFSLPQKRATLNIYEVLQLLHRRISSV